MCNKNSWTCGSYQLHTPYMVQALTSLTCLMSIISPSFTVFSASDSWWMNTTHSDIHIHHGGLPVNERLPKVLQRDRSWTIVIQIGVALEYSTLSTYPGSWLDSLPAPQEEKPSTHHLHTITLHTQQYQPCQMYTQTEGDKLLSKEESQDEASNCHNSMNRLLLNRYLYLTSL